MTPTLIVVSGPAGTGKTTLAHCLARAVGCPAICRDEIKEGMVHATPGFVAGPADEVTRRTLPVFFRVLEVLLHAGVSTVAEAAFQDKVWRPNLEPFRDLARLQVIQCVVDPRLGWARTRDRAHANPLRRAHADLDLDDEAAYRRLLATFDRVAMDVPMLEVDTSDGYRPGLDEIVGFVGRASLV
jgi:predicted kinase